MYILNVYIQVYKHVEKIQDNMKINRKKKKKFYSIIFLVLNTLQVVVILKIDLI